MLPGRSLRQGSVAAAMLGCSFGLATPGCSEERGELVIIVTNDMVPPKDLDRVRVRVAVAGASKHDQAYSLDPAADGSLKLPATIAVVEGDDPLAAVDVRVIGFRNGAARTLTRIVTTIPHQRVGMVRVPIQWLCEGEVIEAQSGVFESACEPQDGQPMVCRAGTCEAVTVASESLPAFDEKEAFGGNSQNDRARGSCFPAEDCFDDGFDVSVERVQCTVVIPAETGAAVNFAVLTPEDGLCSESRCYVPLERSDTLGWREVSLGGGLPPDGGIGGESAGGAAGETGASSDDSGSTSGEAGFGGSPGSGPSARLRRFRLPTAVCTRIDDGRALGVRASTSERCGFTKTPRYPTCGPWSSVGRPPE
jgi:hypothetical protein